MSIDAATILRSVLFAGLASGLSLGCLNTVTTFDDDEGGCTTPKPESSGWCPPAWICSHGEWVDSAGACPDPCPAERPSDGDPCPADGVICEYEEYTYECYEPGFPQTVKVQCTDAGWTTLSSYCLPPTECPDEPPIAGTDCSGWYDAYYCAYSVPSACGLLWMSAYCEWNGQEEVWVANVDESCAAGCTGFDDAAGCEASPACRWLAKPGCDDTGATPVVGCFDAEPCSPDGCGEGATCAVVSYDPCWNQSCDACAAETTVCLALEANP